MNIQDGKTDSDLSSDSSWTLLNDSQNSSKENASVKANTSQKGDNKEVLELKTENICEESNTFNVSDTSFINVDEFCLERLAESEKPTVLASKKSKKRKTQKKYCEDPISFLTIAACLLTITGITLLTTFLPPTFAESSEIEYIKSQLAEVYESANDPDSENAVKGLQAVGEVIDIANNMDVFNMLSQNISDEESCDALSDNYNKGFLPENASEFKIRIYAPYAKEMYDDVSKPKLKEKDTDRAKSIAEIVKDIVKSPSLQMFVATLIQDLCLIKLITEFSKKVKDIPEAKDKVNDAAVKKVVNKLKRIPGVTKSRGKKANIKESAVKKFKPRKSGVLMTDSLIEKCPSSENGKSECERRFEELDTKGSTLGEQHRQKIQQIRNKFQKEIINIKEREKEGYNRVQKINFTREKFLQRLKSDREIYLNKLRKIRDERKQLLDEVCHGVSSADLGSKDASVGNYAVVLPKSYSFTTRLIENLREISPKSNLEDLSIETVSHVDFDGKSDFSKAADPEKKLKSHTDKYCDLKRKYLKKKAKIMERKQARKDKQEVQDVVSNIVNLLSVSLSTVPASEEKPTEQENSSTELQELQEFKVVTKKKPRKRNLELDKLYEAAFEDRSREIEKQDALKWSRTSFDDFNWPSLQASMTKQDPAKTHKARIVHKGVL